MRLPSTGQAALAGEHFDTGHGPVSAARAGALACIACRHTAHGRAHAHAPLSTHVRTLLPARANVLLLNSAMKLAQTNDPQYAPGRRIVLGCLALAICHATHRRAYTQVRASGGDCCCGSRALGVCGRGGIPCSPLHSRAAQSSHLVQWQQGPLASRPHRRCWPRSQVRFLFFVFFLLQMGLSLQLLRGVKRVGSRAAWRVEGPV